MNEDQTVEQEIQAMGLSAPRIAPADIESAVASEHYFTAWEGIFGHAHSHWDHDTSDQMDGEDPGSFAMRKAEKGAEATTLLTFCVLVMRNGFTVVGKSACASPANFSERLGQKIARQDAVQQCWPLLGYELRTKLSQGAGHEP